MKIEAVPLCHRCNCRIDTNELNKNHGIILLGSVMIWKVPENIREEDCSTGDSLSKICTDGHSQAWCRKCFEKEIGWKPTATLR